MTSYIPKTIIMAALSSALVACGGKKTSTPTPPAPVAPAPPAPVNTAPTAVISAQSTTVEEGDTVELDGTSSSDPENDSLSYYWVQTAGRDLRISDRTTAQQNLRVPDLDIDETVEFELTVSDGALDAVSTQTITLRNVDQSPKLNAPAFNDPGTEFTFDGPVSLRPFVDYYANTFFPSRTQDILPIVADLPSGPELLALFHPGTGDRLIGATSENSIQSFPVFDDHIEYYSIDSDILTNTTDVSIFNTVNGSDARGTEKFAVGLDSETSDLVAIAIQSSNSGAPIELERQSVSGACKFLGDLSTGPTSDLDVGTRYLAVALDAGGVSLWSMVNRFNIAGTSPLQATNFDPRMKFEGTFIQDKSFCGPAQPIPNPSSRAEPNALKVLDIENTVIRHYILANVQTNAVGLVESSADAIDFDLGSIPNLTFKDGAIEVEDPTKFELSTDLWVFFGVWTDGLRDGEHRLVVVSSTGEIAIKPWDKGVPETVRRVSIGETPAADLPRFFSSGFPSVLKPDGRQAYAEPSDFVVTTPNTPDLVIFRASNYRFVFRITRPGVFGGTLTFDGLRALPIFPITDAQYLEVGLDATDVDSVLRGFNRGDSFSEVLSELYGDDPTRLGSTEHLTIVYRDQKRIRQIPN